MRQFQRNSTDCLVFPDNHDMEIRIIKTPGMAGGAVFHGSYNIIDWLFSVSWES